MVKYYLNPFAVSGDKAAIPNPTQISGSVSYTDGFGLDYQKNLATDPTAKPFPRAQFNELMYEVTLNLQQYQQHGAPEFITTADNGGVPFPYARSAVVRFDTSGVGTAYKNYISLEDANSDTPPSSKWAVWEPVSIQNSIFSYKSTTGSANAYVVTLNPAITVLVAGLKIEILANFTNTSTATLNVNGLGAVTIKASNPVGLSNLSGGEIINGNAYVLIYNGTNFQLMNPSISSEIIARVHFDPAGAGQTLTSNAITKLNFDTTTFDPFTLWDATNKNFVIPVTGKYEIGGSIVVQGGETNKNLSMLTFVNGVAVSLFGYNDFFTNGATTGASGSDILQLTAGQVLDLRAQNRSTTSPLTIVLAGSFTTDVQNFLTLQYLGS